jgi:Glycosyl hydrolases family 38 N-terminal domain/Alpha mannosidase middle domain
MGGIIMTRFLMRRPIAFILWIALSAAAGLAAGCSPSPPVPPSGPEGQFRAQLGIPPDAKTVVIFQQAAHLDIDWQKTFDDYYTSFVGDIFLEARQLLDAQPRAFYSVTEMGFLQHHVEQHPEELDALKAQAARNALRIVGGGMTSPDMNLPETETLLRDFLQGARFSEDVLGARATAAYLPDSFGHSGTVPDVLTAAGFTSVGFARIDGAPTLLEGLNHPDMPLKPGSTAVQLQQLGNADFVWRGPGGGKVLAHYVASGLYCTGDNIDYDEQLQLPGSHLGVYYGDDPTFTDGKIDSYVAALQPYAKTPYIFVPVGCDFQHPKTELIGYLDGYNQRQYPKTGVWAVAAPLDDYETLVDFHRAELPELPAELTPYFMGFYASRAELKRRVREAARPLWAAETFATVAADGGASVAAALAPAFDKLALTDHHDFVTGTSTDAVLADEQLPLTDDVEAAGRAALAEVAAGIAARIPPAAGSVGRVLTLNSAGATRTDVIEVTLDPIKVLDGPLHARAGTRVVPLEIVRAGAGREPETVRLAVEQMPGLGWRTIDLYPGAEPPARQVTLQLLDGTGQPASGDAVVRVVLQNARVRAEWNRAPNFALTSLTIDGTEALAGGSFLVNDYSDMGGLWRLGNEMSNCTLTPIAPAAQTEQVTILKYSALTAGVAFQTADATREAWLDAGSGGLELALTAAASVDANVLGRTRTVSFAFAAAADAPLRTSLPGGYSDRVPEKVYTPTFWPAVAWLSTGNWAVLLRQSSGVRLAAGGAVELMAVRNTPSGEQCDVLGGTGSDPNPHRFEWRIEAAPTPAAAETAAQLFNRPIIALLAGSTAAATQDLPIEQSLAQVSGDGILSALKPAERGGGVIVRALLEPGPVSITLAPLYKGQLVHTDSSERDLNVIGPFANPIALDRDSFGAIATVRLR